MHRYYLRNLCDEARFPGWALTDHVPLLQALMEQWRAELARRPLAMSEAEACAALGLAPKAGGAADGAADGVVSEEDMRRAYRALARKYHPDKNPSPEARAKFLEAQRAYERLQAGAAGGQGPQAWRVALMLRAQCVLYARCAEALAPFKYAGYPLLLEVLRQQGAGDAAAAGAAAAEAAAAAAAAAAANGGGGDGTGAEHHHGSSGGGGGGGAAGGAHFLHGERVGLVQAAVELTWLTCVASERNAEELLRCGGAGVLASLLSRCAGVLPADAAPTAPEAVIATHALRTLAGLAAVPAARRELEGPAYRQAVADVVRCCALERAHGAVEAALVAAAQMAASPALQAALLEAGALPHIVPLLLGYDSTLAPDAAARLALPFGPATGRDELRAALGAPLMRANVQEARSQQALLAARALARLAGLLPAPHATPECAPAQLALRALLTESLAARLAAPDPRPLLALLGAAGVETAHVIWNGGMRDELLKV